MAKKKSKTYDYVLGTALTALGVLILGALIAIVFILREPNRDPETNCPADGPKAIHAIMIDRSDPITPAQVQQIRQHLQRAINRTEEDTRMDIYSFEGALTNVLQPVLSICAPRKPEEIDPWTQSPPRQIEIYKRFTERLNAEIDGLLAAHTQETSPIIESLRGAAQSSFGLIERGQVPLKITLISDLIQNTTAVSHFRVAPDFEAVQRSNLWSALRPDLKGAEVEVLYILRTRATRGSRPIQNIGHQQFWEALLVASGGRPLGIWPIGGAQ